MRGIFVGLPRDSAGWLFYVPSLKRTYISMGACDDEVFSSLLVLLHLPFKCTIRLCHTGMTNLKDNVESKRVGTLVDSEETYPNNTNIPLPKYNSSSQHDTYLSISKRGPNTRRQIMELQMSLVEKEQDKINTFFVSMTNEPLSPHHDYMMYGHKISGEDKLDHKKKDKDINLSDSLPDPHSLSQGLRCAKSVRNKWGTEISKEICGPFDSNTLGTDKKTLTKDKIVTTRPTCKAKLNSHGGLDKLKARLCLRGNMRENLRSIYGYLPPQFGY